MTDGSSPPTTSADTTVGRSLTGPSLWRRRTTRSPDHERWWRSRLFGFVAVGLAAFLASAWVLDLSRAHLDSPFRYSSIDDTKFYLALIRTIVRTGWYTPADALGAPFGQQLHDFPQGADNLNFVLIRVIAEFTGNPALIDNLFYLLTFPLIAISAYAAMAALGVRRGPAAVAAIVFAELPYHFYRGESQLLLSAYYSVPITAYLFISVLQGRPLFARGVRRRYLPGWVSVQTAVTLTLCVIIGSSGLYYAAFGLVLLASGGAILVVTKRRGLGLQALLCAAAIGLVVGANLAPDLIYRAEHGSNALLRRSLADTETLGLKPAQLLLPVQDHRLPVLRKVEREYAHDQGGGYCEQCYETLGTAGDIGFIWLLVGALASIAGLAWWKTRSPLLPALATGLVLCLLIASVGGASSLLAHFVTPDIRGWNRMSLFIAFFSLMAFALLLERLISRRPRAGWVAVALVAVTVVAVLDETTEDFVPNYAAARSEYRSDTAFFSAVQARLGAGSSVFELPYVPFPEGYGAATMGLNFVSPSFGTSYEEFRGYITSTGLNWSFGAMKGRPEDWQHALAAKPLATAVAAASLSGFSGLVIYPRAYATTSTTLRAELERQLSEPPLVSSGGSTWFFDLRRYATSLEARVGSAHAAAVRRSTLHPLAVGCVDDTITLENPSAVEARRAAFAVELSGTSTGTPVVLSLPGGVQEPVPPLGPAPTTVRAEVTVPPGKSRVRVLSTAPVRAAGSLQATNATLTDPALAGLPAGPPNPVLAGYPAPPCPLSLEHAAQVGAGSH